MFLSFFGSVREVEEVVSSIVVLPHTIAADTIANEEGSPCYSPEFSIEVLDPPSLYNIFPKASVHVVEVEVLSSGGSRMDDGTLHNGEKVLARS